MFGNSFYLALWGGFLGFLSWKLPILPIFGELLKNYECSAKY